jgi:hypothetical protein
MIDVGSELRVDPLEEPEGLPAPAILLMAAELAECTCPEFCERDHDNE